MGYAGKGGGFACLLEGSTKLFTSSCSLEDDPAVHYVVYLVDLIEVGKMRCYLLGISMWLTRSKHGLFLQ